MIRDAESLHQVAPILLEDSADGGGIRPADIVLDSKYAPVPFGSRHYVAQDRVTSRTAARYIGDETLHQNPIQPVLLHPAEVPGHRAAVAR